jgi:hypothetical protein
MRKYIDLLLILVLIIGNYSIYGKNAQLPISFTYHSLTFPLSDISSIDTKIMPPFNLDYLKASDDSLRVVKKHVPFRFGYEFIRNYSLTNCGTWNTIDSGARFFPSLSCGEGWVRFQILTVTFLLNKVS